MAAPGRAGVMLSPFISEGVPISSSEVPTALTKPAAPGTPAGV